MGLEIRFPKARWDYHLSGVYRITFSDGTYYIGSSVHLWSRACAWVSLVKTPSGRPGIDIGTAVLNKLKEGLAATIEVVELCSAESVRDTEAYYLDLSKDDPLMLSDERVGAWKSVFQYTKDGTFIKKHYSISSAARSIGVRVTAIQRVLTGERGSVKDMVFIYEHDYHKRRVEIIKKRCKNKITDKKKGRNVILIGHDGTEEKVFKNIKDAAESVGANAKSVSMVLSGHQVTAAGRRFKYQEKETSN